MPGFGYGGFGTGYFGTGGGSGQPLTLPIGREPQSVKWKMGLYDLDGTPLGPILGARSRELEFNLNGIDTLSFNLDLDHRLATTIQPLKSVVKVWRWINENGDDEWKPSQPIFGGIVGPLRESMSSGQFGVNVFSPFWRLQKRHARELLEFLSTDQGQILWGLIEYTNAFDATGIVEGTIPATKTRDRHYNRGKQIWDALVKMTNVIGGPDLFPEYVHTNGSPDIVEFSILEQRGQYRPNAHLHGRVGKNNLSDVEREFAVDEIATWVTADGGEGGTLTSTVEDVDQINEIGLYESFLDFTSDGIVVEATLEDHARSHLETNKTPTEDVQPTIAIGRKPMYDRDFQIGDVVPVWVRRGRMDISVNRRVYSTKLTLSDLGVENSVSRVDADTSMKIDPDIDEDAPVSAEDPGE